MPKTSQRRIWVSNLGVRMNRICGRLTNGGYMDDSFRPDPLGLRNWSASFGSPLLDGGASSLPGRNVSLNRAASIPPAINRDISLASMPLRSTASGESSTTLDVTLVRTLGLGLRFCSATTGTVPGAGANVDLFASTAGAG